MSKYYRYLDENGHEWTINQEEMDGKIKYLKDNVYEEDGKEVYSSQRHH